MPLSPTDQNRFRIQHTLASVWLDGRRFAVPALSPADAVSNCSATREATDQRGRETVPDTQQQIEALMQSIGQQSRALFDQRQSDLCELRALAVQIGIAAAEHLLQEEISNGQQNIAAVVQLGLGQFETQDAITVRLHPSDFELCHEANPSEKVQFVSDPTVPRGDCQMESGVNTLVMDWRERLGSLQQRLLTGLDDARLEH